MELSVLERRDVINGVEQILHAPGNYSGGILEMTVVIDASMAKEDVAELVPCVLSQLKRHSEVFRNTLFHVIYWINDETMEDVKNSMSMAMLSSFYENYRQQKEMKKVESLLAYLRLFHARSKLILLFTPEGYRVEDETKANDLLQPFLGRKLLRISNASGFQVKRMRTV